MGRLSLSLFAAGYFFVISVLCLCIRLGKPRLLLWTGLPVIGPAMFGLSGFLAVRRRKQLQLELPDSCALSCRCWHGLTASCYLDPAEDEPVPSDTLCRCNNNNRCNSSSSSKFNTESAPAAVDESTILPLSLEDIHDPRSSPATTVREKSATSKIIGQDNVTTVQFKVRASRG